MSTSKTDTNKTDEKNLIQAAEKQSTSNTLNTDNLPILDEALALRVSALEIKDTATVSQDAPLKAIKPQEEEVDIRLKLALLHARYPLTPIRRPEVSTFIPTGFNLFEVIHYMDQLIAGNIYFRNAGFPWHPFISRIYFAELMFYQTLRAMHYARIGSRLLRTWTEQLMKDIPPESLPLPGPVFPVYQALCVSQPEKTTYGPVCPNLPENLGPATADQLIPVDSAYYGLPNIPFLIGMANTIIHADDNNVPNYNDPATFNEQNAITINGTEFEGPWNQAQRTVLCQPGMAFRPDVPQDVTDTFHRDGNLLRLPVLAANTSTQTIEDYLQLGGQDWLPLLIPMMSEYTSHFNDSGTLADCSPSGLPCGLLSTRLNILTSRIAAENQIFTLNSAFPNQYRLHEKVFADFEKFPIFKFKILKLSQIVKKNCKNRPNKNSK